MHALLSFLFLGFLFSGCAVRMREIGPATLPSDFERVNAELGLFHGRAVLQSGDTLRGSRFLILPDSTLWQAGRRHERRAFANSDILNVSVINRSESPWPGMRRGAVIGGSTGGVLGAVCGLYAATTVMGRDYSDSPQPGDSLSHPMYGRRTSWKEARWYPLYGLLIGAGLGAIFGGTLGFLLPQFGYPVMVTYRFSLNPPHLTPARN